MLMSHLFISFAMAMTLSAALLSLLKLYHLEHVLNTLFPIVPFVYAICYQALDKMNAKRPAPQRKAEPQAAAPSPFRTFDNISMEHVFVAVLFSLVIKLAFEGFFTYALLRLNGQSFTEVYGVFGRETIMVFILGQHPWLNGNELMYFMMLLVVAILVSVCTGAWIGYMTKGNAILLGVIVGTIVTMINAVTNMQLLYMRLVELTNELTGALGLTTDLGFIIVMGLQVLLYGFWSGVARWERDKSNDNKGRKRKTSAG